MNRAKYFISFVYFPVVFLLSLLLFMPKSADTKEGILFILDSSGSMWGRVDNQPKIVVAKEVLTNLLKELPSQLESGLLVYGHRKKGDCKDIELVSNLGSSKEETFNRINNLNALGKTPISGALITAGVELKDREDTTTVVLISDGIETCEGDPCGVAENIVAQGINFVLHVIGFDVDTQAAEQLSCIASAGGGKYFQAESIDQLKSYLSQVQTSVVEKTKIPVPPPPPEVDKVEPSKAKSKTKTIRIAGPGVVILKPAPWVSLPPEKWSLGDIETGTIKATGKESQLRVAAGEYQIRWDQTQHNHQEIQLTNIIKVKPGTTVEAPIDTGIRLTLPEGIGDPYWWGLIMPGEKKVFWKTKETGTGQVVPAGTYQLYYHQKQHGSSPQRLQMVTIEEGKLNDIILDSGLIFQPANWLTTKPYYMGLKDEKGRIIAKWNELKPQIASPGKYQLFFQLTQHHHNRIQWGDVAIEENSFTTVPINSGLKFNHDPQAKPPYRIYLVNLESKKVIESRESWDSLPAPPGKYRLDWRETQHGSKRQVLVDEFEIEADTLVELDL